MPRIAIDLDDNLAAALDRLIAATDRQCPREDAVIMVLQDWLAEAGYLSEEIAEGTVTEKDD